YALGRGVLHRDLKPANLILGEYGEVYVLDWGLAKVIGETELARDDRLASSSPDATNASTLLGTPGYMAPEQIEDASRVGPAADVYALAAILFEILTLEPLHERAGHRLERARRTPRCDAADQRRARARPAERERDGDDGRSTDAAARVAAARARPRGGAAVPPRPALDLRCRRAGVHVDGRLP